ncbi:MAG: sugar ABC transporter permease [Actinomycetota bacterium]|nr:sugar ABC transporter permease [Actinomycetota bacterium]
MPPLKRGLRRAAARRANLAGYAFVSPALLLFLLFIGGPLVAAFALAFVHWDLLTPPQFAGLSNIERLIGDEILRQVLVNTFVFAFASVVTHVGLGMLLALAVNRKMNRIIQYWLRTAFFFPFLISWAAVALLWKYVLDPNFGIVSHYLAQLGIEPPSWLLDPGWAMPSIIAVDWWHTIGYTFVILLAGLQTVPRHLEEAAMIDGAGAVRRFWSVTLPSMSPTLFFAVIITFIGAFQIFDPMFIMTAGGPGNSTRSMVLYTYQQAFQAFDVGYGAAVSIVVFLVIMLVTLVQFRLSRLWVHQ